MTDLRPGAVVDGRYLLEERIGLGGMAAVWRASDRKDGGAAVALKVLREDFLRRNPREAENNVRRFKREGEILRLLAGCEHVVAARGAGRTEEGGHYLAMELLVGRSLRAYMKSGKRAMSLGLFARLAARLARGLAEIHAKGVVHRDLSPDNVVVTIGADGRPSPKFLDFGIGRGLGQGLDQVTKLVTIMGKPQYFSPEQAKGAEPSPASDVFSLSVMLYEMASGTLPINLAGAPLLAAVKRIVGEDPLPIESTPEGARLPGAIRKLIGRGLSKSAEERPALEEIAAACEALAAEHPDDSLPTDDRGPDENSFPATDAEAEATQHPRGELKPGDLLGRFEIKRRVGRGGMGEVYRAWDTVLHRDVALKVASKVEGEAAQKALLREARASSGLRNEHIVTVYDAGVHSGLPYIVMEFVEGRTLAEVVEEDGPLVGDRFWRYARGVVAGLAAAHEHEPPVIHKDLKPGNILIAGEVAKIADFGLAVIATTGLKGDSFVAGTAHGSIHTMSPEQAEGGRLVDERSDVYSLGCVFYMMTTGAPPFDGNEIAILYRHQNDAPEPPSVKNPKFSPPGLEAVILRCLEKAPERRYASAREALAALTPLFQSAARAPLVPWFRRTSTLVSVVAGLVAVALLLVVLKLMSEARTINPVFVDRQAWRNESAAPYLVRGDAVRFEFSSQSEGLLRSVARSRSGGPETVAEFAFGASGRQDDLHAVQIPLPASNGAEIDVVVERVGHAETLRVFTVVVDSAPPTIFVEIGGVRFPVFDPVRPAETHEPIAVIDWSDAKLVAADHGGLRGGGHERSISFLETRGGEGLGVVSSRSSRTGDELTLVVAAEDEAGNKSPEVSVVLQRAALLAEIEPSDGAAIAGGTLAVRWSDFEASDVAGFDASNMLTGIVATAVATTAAREEVSGPSAEFVRSDDGSWRADVAPPTSDGLPRAYPFRIELRREGRRLDARRKTAGVAGVQPAFFYDGSPPRIEVFANGARVEARNGVVEVDVRSSDSDERIAFLAVDAGPPGAAAPEVRQGDGPWRPASPDPIPMEGPRTLTGETKLQARDAAGNVTEARLRFSERPQRVTAATIGTGGRLPPGKEKAYVRDTEILFVVETEDLAADDRLFLKVEDSTLPSDAPPTPLALEEGRASARVSLGVKPGLVAERRLTVLMTSQGREGTKELGSFLAVFDDVPPEVRITRDGRFPVEPGSATTLLALGSLEVAIVDPASGVDPDPEASPVRFSGDVRRAESTPTADGRGVIVAAGPTPATGIDRVVRVRVEASDRAGNRAAPVEAEVLVPADALLVLDDEVGRPVDSGPERGRRLLRMPSLAFRVQRRADLSDRAAEIAAVTGLEGRPEARETSFNLPSGSAGSAEFLVPLDVPEGTALLRGETRVFVRESGADRAKGALRHQIDWVLDREPPRFRALKDGLPADASKTLGARDWSGVVVEVEDDHGFSALPEGAAAAGLDAEFVDARKIRLKIAAPASHDARTFREFSLPVQDAAGNETLIEFAVERFPEALALTEFSVGSIGKFDGSEWPSKDAAITARVANVAGDAQGFRIVLTKREGAGFISPADGRSEPVSFGARKEAEAEFKWNAEDGDRFRAAFHGLAAQGMDELPFAVRDVLIDRTLPETQFFLDGVRLGRDAVLRPDRLDGLELRAVDLGSGIAPRTFVVSIEPASGAVLEFEDSVGGDGATKTILRVRGDSPPGEFVLGARVFDRAGNQSAVATLRFSRSAAGGEPDPTVKKPLGDFSAAERDAALAEVRRRSGVELAPIGAAGAPLFYLARTEATAGQFRRFATALEREESVAKRIAELLLRPAPKEEAVRAQAAAARALADEAGGDDMPVRNVPESVAYAFAAWLGGTVPTWDEWSAAAGRLRNPRAGMPLREDGSDKGSRDKAFAWYGATPPLPRSVVGLADGWFGLKGMAGNVAEWVEFRGGRRLAGGSYRSESFDYAECLNNEPDAPTAPSVRGTAGVRVRWPGTRAP